MSKPIARVVFSVLLALALIAGIYTSVQGAMLNAGTKSGQAHVNLGLHPDRTSIQSPDSFGLQADPYGKREHGCHADSSINPEDY